MRCVFCDAKLKDGCLFCPDCGKEVQIVPDYNEFDDDYINGLIGLNSEEEKKKKAKAIAAEKKQNIIKKQQEQKRKKKRVLICSFLIAVLVIIIATVILIMVTTKRNNDNSVSYQINKAQEAYAKGDIEAAVSYYDRALVLDEKNIQVMQALADIYLSKKDTSAALVFLKQILTYDKYNKTAVEKLKKIYSEAENYEELLALYDSISDNKELADMFSEYMTSDPEFNILSGDYMDALDISITSKDNYTIYYTTDGQNPKEYGMKYERVISFKDEGDYEVQAVCVNKYGLYSNVIIQKYKIEFEKPKMPIVSPDGGSCISETTVSISVPDGCSAYYVWGSSDPNANSTKYKKPFLVPEGNNVLSVIVINNKTGKCSDVYRGHFEYYSQEE